MILHALFSNSLTICIKNVQQPQDFIPQFI